ncbi:MAG TPA: hypothetical protein VFA04_21515 [Bryobacteraceae bacterium]|jgi:hypothetical protein|nr:hypothetical protein [Bryobacteraceae bacterium]
MLNWICPECGRENDPKLVDCPGCSDPQPVVKRRTVAESRPRRVLASRVPLHASATPPVASEPIANTGPLPATVEPVLPGTAAGDGIHCQALGWDHAPRVSSELPEPADFGHGAALASMLDAIVAEPEPLAPVVALAPEPIGMDEFAAVPKELCGRVRVPRPVMLARTGTIVIRQRAAAEEHTAPPAVPDSSAIAQAHALPFCDEILLGRGPNPSAPEPPHPNARNALARSRRRLAFPSSDLREQSFAPAHLCGAVNMPRPVLHSRAMAVAPSAMGPLATAQRKPALPSALRHFQEAVVPRIAYLKRPGAETAPVAAATAPERRGIPGWAITIGTAMGVLLVALFAVQRFTARADVHAASAPAAAVSTPPAYGAWPSIDKYVEVTGVRITTDQKQNSEAVFSIVNHSSADIGAMAVKLTVPAVKAGDPPLCDVSTNVEGLAPWEAREIRVPLAREVHASELPDWRDMRPQVSITSPQ